jgi:hypothetical protein
MAFGEEIKILVGKIKQFHTKKTPRTRLHRALAFPD